MLRDAERKVSTELEPPSSIPLWRQVIDQGAINAAVFNHDYDGAGTEKDPYVVKFLDDDFRDPLKTPPWLKWTYAIVMAFATLAVSLISSAYAGGLENFIEAFDTTNEIALTGLSVYVLGFAIGPLLWAPLSEQYGRQILYWTTYGAFAAFNAGVCGARNIETVIVLRFFAGSFGSSPLTNAGGVIADLFAARQRGLALSIFAIAPFLGPCTGPIIGGFIGQSLTPGWKWLAGFMAVFSAAMCIVGVLVVPETYPPVLLRKRATRLSKLKGKVYRSKPDIDRGHVTTIEIFKTSLSRPWILLLREPIVLILTLYMGVVYATLYLCFAAFPIIFQELRHWDQGKGGLAFTGIALGMLAALAYSIFVDRKHYEKVCDQNGGWAPPEARLPASMIGAVALPVGLFWFAWTNSPSILWAVPIAAGIPFGFGMVLLFLCAINYLIDSYVIFAASVLSANSVLRSVFGAVFPLFTTQMYKALGIHWATTVPAVLALICLPFPFLFYRYGESIRLRCKYAAEADAFMKSLRIENVPGEREMTKDDHQPKQFTGSEIMEPQWQLEKGLEKDVGIAASNPESPTDANIGSSDSPGQLLRPRDYEGSPYDIDRVHTKDSFRSA